MRKGRFAAACLAAAFGVLVATGTANAGNGGIAPLRPQVSKPVAFDISPPLRAMAAIAPDRGAGVVTSRPERGTGPVGNHKYTRDGALRPGGALAPNAMPSPLFSFEGPNQEDNFRTQGRRVNPPDPVGDVGMHHYVAMDNLTFAIYSKTGAVLYGPAAIGSLWQNFPVTDCAGGNGDPIVVFDEISNRWILTQFTSQGPDEFWNCVAVSTTDDPLGSYARYAFSTGEWFPDYPKYGLMPEALYITTREFGPLDTDYRIGIYAIDRHALVEAQPDPSVVAFYLTDGIDPLYRLGDGLLPADLDGKRHPPPHSPEYFAGTMDDGAFYGAPRDAINWYGANVDFSHPDDSTFGLIAELPTAPFDSIYPCAPGARDCLPQPGITDPNQYLDILSYRQRPTYRLQYRNFRTHESLVTTQSVEARPSQAGMRWYEIRNPQDPVIHQQGTYAPNDGVHRWMGSVASDRKGNIALGYSVVNGTSVFPGIRYAGRLAGDPLGELSQGEAVLQNGSGVQRTVNSRWGDYTSLNVDPKDDCTFYYINEYYTAASEQTSLAGWLTRIGAFRFPGCR
ncbi:MAG TPA: hypothetical protein VE615_12135 [Gaiellaceae bacterium]|jgi:hypothetical protein|nr:hypothetical protein [Gaiellaceae bacterium]